MIGNSRHTLERYRRLFWPKGVRILALDTGGLSLSEAMWDGRLTTETITDRLKGLSTTVKPISLDNIVLKPKQPETACLPYPIWEALGSEKLAGIEGCQIKPCPVVMADLPTFLDNGCKLDIGMNGTRVEWRVQLKHCCITSWARERVYGEASLASFGLPTSSGRCRNDLGKRHTIGSRRGQTRREAAGDKAGTADGGACLSYFVWPDRVRTAVTAQALAASGGQVLLTVWWRWMEPVFLPGRKTVDKVTIYVFF